MLEKEWCEDGSSFEGDTLDWRPFAIRDKEVTEGLSELFPTVSTWKLENILSPFCDNFISVVDIFDKV